MLEAFGVPATVTRPAPNDTPIETTALWVAPIPEGQPIGAEWPRQEPHKVMALPLADVPTVPHGTLIEAPEFRDGPVKTWRKDGDERREYDHVRVFVVEVDNAT